MIKLYKFIQKINWYTILSYIPFFPGIIKVDEYDQESEETFGPVVYCPRCDSEEYETNYCSNCGKRLIILKK